MAVSPPLITRDQAGTCTAVLDGNTALALAQLLSQIPDLQPEMVALREALLGSPSWRTEVGQGIQGILPVVDYQSFLASRGLPG